MAVSGRLMTLDGAADGPGPPVAKGFPQITATAEATTYLLPADQGLFNGASPSTPSATTQAAGSTGSDSGGGSSAPYTVATAVVIK